MKPLRSALVPFCLLVFLSAHSAKAQFSIYGTAAVTDYGYGLNSNGISFGGDHPGFGFGATYNFPVQSRLTAGIDLRGSVTPSSTGGEKGFASLRFGFVPHSNPFRPYGQIGGGFVSAKVPASSSIVGAQTFTVGAIDLAIGLDFRLTPSLDLRLLEIESGAGIKNSANAGSASISTGVVYHFHGANP